MVLFMRFHLNGESFDLDPEIARVRILGSTPDPVQTHWVEIDGRRWPAKQALETATGISRSNFISHTAVRVLSRLGFETSDIPSPSTSSPRTAEPPESFRRRPAISSAEAADAFAVLDTALQQRPLTSAVSSLEAALAGADADAVERIAHETRLDHDVIDAALIVRERIGVIDSLIHAAVITQTLPLLLESGEYLIKRPSLAAGNDLQRIFDLETNIRVAEFKVAQWKGADSLRQRGLVADLVGLTMDSTGRRRQLFVVGERPKHFLKTSTRTVDSLLSKSALRLRQQGVWTAGTTVADLTRDSGVEVVDLVPWFPRLGS